MPPLTMVHSNRAVFWHILTDELQKTTRQPSYSDGIRRIYSPPDASDLPSRCTFYHPCRQTQPACDTQCQSSLHTALYGDAYFIPAGSGSKPPSRKRCAGVSAPP